MRLVAGGMTGGGWGKRGLGIPLGDRVRAGNLGAAGTPTGRSASGPSPARHCWVADAVDQDGVKRPGLLVEWRQTAAGWDGRVVYSARLRETDGTLTDPPANREWVVVEEWLPAARLTPL